MPDDSAATGGQTAVSAPSAAPAAGTGGGSAAGASANPAPARHDAPPSPKPAARDAGASAPKDSTSAATTASPVDTAKGTVPRSATTEDRGEGHEATTPAPAKADDAATLDKRYRDTQAAFTRERQAHLDLQRQMQQMQQQIQQYQGIDPAAIRRWQDEQRPQWHPQHPQHAAFKEMLSRVDLLQSMIDQAKTPEHRQFAVDQLNRMLTPQQAQAIREFRSAQQARLQELAADPEGFMRKHFESNFRQAYPAAQQQQQQLQQQHHQGYAEAQQWVSAFQPTPQERQQVQAYLAQGYRFDHATALIENARLKSQTRASEDRSASAEEKERLLKAKATVTRDQVTENVTTRNLYQRALAEAKKRGVDPGDERFMNILDSLRKQVRKA